MSPASLWHAKQEKEGERRRKGGAGRSLTVSGDAAGTYTALVALHQGHTGSLISELPRVDVPHFYIFIPRAGAQKVAAEVETAV